MRYLLISLVVIFTGQTSFAESNAADLTACDSILTKEPEATCTAGKADQCKARLGLTKIKYPERAFKEYVYGCVAIIYDITKDGTADNFRIFAETPKTYGFSLAVLDALMKQPFEKNNEVKNWKAIYRFDPVEYPAVAGAVKNFKHFSHINVSGKE